MAWSFARVHVHVCIGVSEQALGWFLLGLGLVVEDEPSEFSCTQSQTHLCTCTHTQNDTHSFSTHFSPQVATGPSMTWTLTQSVTIPYCTSNSLQTMMYACYTIYLLYTCIIAFILNYMYISAPDGHTDM